MNEHKRERVVLGFAGGAHSVAALTRLVESGHEVIAVTIDVGQERDVDEVRGQALAAGALRAHVFDAREEFARDHVLPALRTGSLDTLDGAALAAPLVARRLAEVAAIEQATTATGADAFDVTPDTRHTRRRGRTLLERPVSDAAHASSTPAQVDLQMQGGMPVAVNGVSLSAAEVLESVALIAGQHGIGRLTHVDAPAAPIIHAAYAALGGEDGVVRFRLHAGTLTLASASQPTASR